MDLYAFVLLVDGNNYLILFTDALLIDRNGHSCSFVCTHCVLLAEKPNRGNVVLLNPGPTLTCLTHHSIWMQCHVQHQLTRIGWEGVK